MGDSGRVRRTLGIGAPAAAVAAGVGWAIVRKALAHKYDLAGKTVFITGGTRGLGLVLAREFGKREIRKARVSPGYLRARAGGADACGFRS